MRGAFRSPSIQTLPMMAAAERAAQDAYQMIREALVPVPTEKGVELMAQWQAIALNKKPKWKPAEYMDAFCQRGDGLARAEVMAH